MKYFLTLLLSLLLSTTIHTYAAHMYISAPKTASSNRAEYVLTVFLDPETQAISALSGDVSFPASFFDIKSISTQNGMIPLWITSPRVSDEKKLDGRTHLVFEGIIPGGFSGVHTSYTPDVQSGVVFTVVLIPKGSGQGNFILSNVELHAYDSVGTIVSTRGDSSPIAIPSLTGTESKPLVDMSNVLSTSLTMEVATSSLINNGAPYVYIRENNPSRAIDHIEIAETDEYNPVHVSIGAWHTVNNPYILTHSSLSEYIHAKVVYTDNTYSYKTIVPVENSYSLAKQSRILVYIVIAIFLLYHYGKNFLYLLPKKLTKRV